MSKLVLDKPGESCTVRDMPSSARLSRITAKPRTRWTDHHAALLVVEMREERGLSQEGLANAIKRLAAENDWYKVHGAVDAFTIRRIERDGHCPSERVRFVIATFFGTTPTAMWQPQNRRQHQETIR